MTYLILKAPFELNFKEMRRERAREYLGWFIGQIPERIPVLNQYIKGTRAYSSWNSDLSPESLDLLGKWFCENVQTRTRSKEEINSMNLPAWLQKAAPPVETELTPMTMNLVIDISMYFGQTLITGNPTLHWGLASIPKNNVDFQQPVILGYDKKFLNPVRILRVYARGIADKSQGPDRLRKLYDIWSNALLE